ncbi:WD40 repeat domain-containing protein [Deinococcus sp. Arct2-2]|uniref:WD40 repeat domain-containing protein n=1 Tax=Deinococcus sp. Arct2-2 TaxID=2568653 RepID=UPI0010A483F7|nr:WD40 repeat domain-containing protein [Deinococcus sp. Arct2-2]THF69424.1 WD40 repeat domain-containing protein [Deinococcus sp. Arct2-2]
MKRFSSLSALSIALSIALASPSALAGSLTATQTYTLNDAAAQDAAWFRDGKRVAIAVENTVVIADPTGKALTTLRGPTEPVTRLSVSPDGTLVAGRSDGVLYVWRVSGGPVIRRWPPVNDTESFPVVRGAFRADNSLLILQNDQDAPLLALNVATGATSQLAEYGPEDLITSSDGKTALVIDYGNAYMIDTATFTKKGPTATYNKVGNAALSPDGAVGGIAGDSGKVQLLSTSAPARTLSTSLKVPGLAFLNSATLLLMEGGNLEQWAVGTGQKVGSVLKSPQLEDTLAVSVSGVAIGLSDDYPPSLFGSSKPSGSNFLRFPASKAQGVGLDGMQAVGVQFDEAFMLGSGTPITSNRSLNSGASTVPVLTSAAGVTAALLDSEAGFKVALVQGGKLVPGPALTAFDDDLQYFQISANGKYLLTHDGYTLAVTDLARNTTTTRNIDDLDLGEDLFDLAAVSADGSEIALVTADGTALRIDSQTDEIMTTAQLPDGAEAGLLDIAPDSTIALSVRRDDQAEVWLFKKNATTPFKQLQFTGWVDDLAFSPDGKALALSVSGLYSGVTVLDPSSGAEVARSVPLSLYGGGLTWNAGGTQVLVGRGTNGKVGSATLLNFKR